MAEESGGGLEMAPLHTEVSRVQWHRKLRDGSYGGLLAGTGPREGLTLTMARSLTMARVNPSSTASFLLAASHLRSLYQRLLRRTRLRSGDSRISFE